MKINPIFLAIALFISLVSCKSTSLQNKDWVSNALDVASSQLKSTAEELTGINQIPRSVHAGYDLNFLDSQLQRENKSYIDSLHPNPPAKDLKQRYICGIEDWTSGFFPGSLWYAYEMTGDEELKTSAWTCQLLLDKSKAVFEDFVISCKYCPQIPQY